MIASVIAIIIFIALPAYELVRQMRIGRRIERNAKSGLSHRQLIARGMID